MDRSIVYPGSIPLDIDILNIQQRAMKAIGALIQAVMGTGTFVDGLACTQTTVPSMSVTVGQGWIGYLTTVDPNAYGSLPADATDPLMKMGINIAATNLGPMSAPATAGQSVVYLVQAAFSEADGTAVVLPYYNATNTAIPYSGPANSGAAQNTVRAQTVTLGLVQGAAATTGSQTTPAPTTGYTGLYAITIANGQTTITSSNIATLATAPFIQFKIPNLTPGFSRLVVFGSSTTWVCPAGVKLVNARVWGAGAGGAGSNSVTNAGGGGGGGGYGEGVYTVVPGTTYTITIGVGGNGVAGSSTANGNPGGSTSFASFLTATGGSGGTPGTSSSGGAGGSGGGVSGATLAIGGQSGGSSGLIGTLVVIGQGGGAFGSQTTLQALSSSSTTSSSPSGSFPGGGGAGSNGGTSGSGGAGLIVLEY